MNTANSLYITLQEHDAQILRLAAQSAPEQGSARGIRLPHDLAQTALGLVCRAVLENGYRPKPLAAVLRADGAIPGAALPAGTIKVQLG
jgi:hypothetical protein